MTIETDFGVLLFLLFFAGFAGTVSGLIGYFHDSETRGAAAPLILMSLFVLSLSSFILFHRVYDCLKNKTKESEKN